MHSQNTVVRVLVMGASRMTTTRHLTTAVLGIGTDNGLEDPIHTCKICTHTNSTTLLSAAPTQISIPKI